VVSHLPPAQRVAAGLRVPPTLTQSFAAAQAAWRFYANPRVSLPQMVTPLKACAQAGVEQACEAYALVVLDWSPLHFGSHPSKGDRITLTNRRDLGYQLLTALCVSDRTGVPLSPLCLELNAADGVHSTRAGPADAEASSLDAVAPVLTEAADALAGCGKPAVFIIDREADSVGHYRAWDEAGHAFLVRADDDRRVRHEGAAVRLSVVVEQLREQDAFAQVREVEFQGKTHPQWVAETTIVLHRPARTHRVDPETGVAKHHNVAGRPLTLRLVVSEVRDRTSGQVLSRWLLLTNLPAWVDMTGVALWYYWRWRIESYHKLLKGAGQQTEAWQQETAAALARRLLVAAMACVVVWQLARDPRPEAEELRGVLVHLSGRQMKRGKAARGFTEPALLAGLGVLIPMLHLLQTHDPNDLRRLTETALPGLLTPPRC